jgi:UrcA family protein
VSAPTTSISPRIGHAADQVCNADEGALDLTARRALAKCRKAAISAAMNSVASIRQVNTLAAAPK